jgi:hypothetical protein
MGIVEYELTRLRQQEIKVKSLVALAKYGNQHQKFKALAKLEEIAYPEKVAEEINQVRLLEEEI